MKSWLRRQVPSVSVGARQEQSHKHFFSGGFPYALGLVVRGCKSNIPMNTFP